MTEIDYDDPEVEERWCLEQRKVVQEYLCSEGAHCGDVGEWPAWHLAPYVAIWAIESVASPGAIGWWAISGDLPTDYISSADIEPPQHPRKAAKAIGEKWLEQAEAWSKGQDYEGVRIAGPSSRQELAPMLSSRASILVEWVEDDSLWEE